MNILHTYCLNYNLGDHALGIGVKRVLRSLLDVTSIGETNLQGTVFDDYFIEIVNKKYDLLVIGGGGIIHGAHWPNGWFWLIEKDKIKQIEIPFIVFGAGYNYFKGEGEIPQKGKDHLLETKKYSAFFSVRNDESFERLKEQTGIDAVEIADPGFFVKDPKLHLKRPVDSPFIVIQVAYDRPLQRFGSEEKVELFIRNMREIAGRLSKDYTVIIAPHVVADLMLSQKIADGLENTFVWDFPSYAFDKAEQIFQFYANAEFVLAMRGHGQILPIGMGTPVISLENHRKNIGLMKKLGLEKWNSDIQDEHFIEKTWSLIGDLRGNLPSISAYCYKKTDELYKDTSTKLSAIKL